MIGLSFEDIYLRMTPRELSTLLDDIDSTLPRPAAPALPKELNHG